MNGNALVPARASEKSGGRLLRAAALPFAHLLGMTPASAISSSAAIGSVARSALRAVTPRTMRARQDERIFAQLMAKQAQEADERRAQLLADEAQETADERGRCKRIVKAGVDADQLALALHFAFQTDEAAGAVCRLVSAAAEDATDNAPKAVQQDLSPQAKHAARIAWHEAHTKEESK